jgi:hypothetical protein
MPLTKIQSLGITDGTIVNADINASAAITLAKLTGVNDAKAWVNFNGTGTVAIRASFNVSSITDNGTGDYTVNFTTAFTDANYAFAGAVQGTSGGGANEPQFATGSPQVYTTTQHKVRTIFTGVGYGDVPIVCLEYFR